MPIGRHALIVTLYGPVVPRTENQRYMDYLPKTPNVVRFGTRVEIDIHRRRRDLW
jgi:hypothetical protein